MEPVREVMWKRAEKLLALCAHCGHDVLVLGAWGCGVFENDPNDVAVYFKRLLSSSSNNNSCVDPATTTTTTNMIMRNEVDGDSSATTTDEKPMNNKLNGRFSRCFKRVVFAVLTNDPTRNNTFMSFRNAFNSP